MDYTLIRSRRLSVSLQVKLGGSLVVRAPHLYPKYLIDRFVESKVHWINKRLLEQQKSKVLLKRYCSDDELKEKIKALIAHYSSLMGLYPTALRYKLTRSYWGSCSPKGVISFNLRLAYTSQAAIEYVVVHELAHLKWRGHGIRFWTLVKKYYPPVDKIRKELRSYPRE